MTSPAKETVIAFTAQPLRRVLVNQGLCAPTLGGRGLSSEDKDETQATPQNPQRSVVQHSPQPGDCDRGLIQARQPRCLRKRKPTQGSPASATRERECARPAADFTHLRVPTSQGHIQMGASVGSAAGPATSSGWSPATGAETGGFAQGLDSCSC